MNKKRDEEPTDADADGETPADERVAKRFWNFYRTAAGNSPVKDFLHKLSDEDAAEIAAAMKDVQAEGKSAARHLRGDIYEVRAQSSQHWLRLLFATEGQWGHVLLGLHAFLKNTKKTPPSDLDLAQTRLRDWRARGRA